VVIVFEKNINNLIPVLLLLSLACMGANCPT